jgi:DNA-binding NarL/FixJ family response regulator
MKPLSRILLADDHAVVRAGIRNALSTMPGVEIVGEVEDGPGVLNALEQLKPDCLLLDITMPEFEPIQAIRQIRLHYPALIILVVSAYDDDVYVQGLLSAGVNGYHLKDQPLGDLRLAVERVLAGKRWISSPLLDKLLNPTKNAGQTPLLSNRQQELLQLLAQGLDNRAMAAQLNLSVKTIENHLTRLYRQINVQSRLEAAHFVQENPEVITNSGQTAVSTNIFSNQMHLERVSILLIDDSRRYRQQLRRMIGKAYPQATLYEASNTAEALQLLTQASPNIVFLDIVLGDEDGIRCTALIKRQSPTTRIVLISAYPDREFHRRGLQAGATAFLDKKDLDTAVLQQILQDVLP